MTKKETTTTTSTACTVSVDRIMNEMSKSFALCKGTNLFQFYDCSNSSSSSRGGAGAGATPPCNWTSSITGGLGGIMSLAAPSTAPTTPSSSSTNSAGASGICGDCSSSSWLSSSKPLDFWNTVNILSSSSPSTDTSTAISTPTPTDGTSSISLTSTMNQIFWEHRIVAAVTQRLEDKFTTFMANNSLQMTTTGIFVGALMGAAVATGVIIGMITAASAVLVTSASSSTTNTLDEEDSSFLSRWIRLLLLQNNKRIAEGGGGGEEASPPNSPTIITASKDSADNHETSSSSSTTEIFDTTTPSLGTTTGTKSSNSVLKANGPLLILQVYPTITTTTKTTDFREQCESCLYNLQSKLVQNHQQWNHIRRLTVFLVNNRSSEGGSSDHNAVTFRKVLCEFNNNNNNSNSNSNGNSSNWNMLISIVYVEKLEIDENALIQIEAMACHDVLVES